MRSRSSGGCLFLPDSRFRLMDTRRRSDRSHAQLGSFRSSLYHDVLPHVTRQNHHRILSEHGASSGAPVLLGRSVDRAAVVGHGPAPDRHFGICRGAIAV